MEEENKNEFQSFDDEWLTRALRARSQAEARPGLEERILARLATEPEGNPQRRWRWMPALAVAFGVLLMVAVGYHFLRVGQPTKSSSARVEPSPVNEEPKGAKAVPSQPRVVTEENRATNAPKPKVARSAKAHEVRPVLAKANALPKLEQFHADSAAQQEKLLAAFLKKQGPARLGELLARKAPPEDLTIEPLNIAPIDLGNIPNN